MKILCFEITYVGFKKKNPINKFVEREFKRGHHFIDVIKGVRNSFDMPLMEAKEAVENCVKENQKLLRYLPEETQERLRTK